MNILRCTRGFLSDTFHLFVVLFTQVILSHLLLLLFPMIVLSKLLLRVIPRPLRPLSKSRNSFFITGASSGIGSALSVVLAAEPSTSAIYLMGRSRERLEATRRACLAVSVISSLRLPMIVGDVTDEEFMRREILFADTTEVEKGGGGLSCVVANAGISGAQVEVPKDGDGFKSSAQIMDINLMGTIHAVAPIVPVFAKRRRGQIVIMSSLASFVSGLPWTAAYGASKAGQRFYGECIRAGLEEHGIDVLTVCPGFVKTGMTAHLSGTLSMMSVQPLVKEVVLAMKRGGVGTLLWPPKDATLWLLFNSLPVEVRYCLGRVMLKAGLTKNFLKIPN